MRQLLLILVVCPIVVSTAHAQSLTVGQVSAPAVNCFYSRSCVVPVQDSRDSVVGLAIDQSDVLRLRTIAAAADAPLAGVYGYQYRVDLRGVVGDDLRICVDKVAIHFRGPIIQFDYNGNGVGEDVYVVTKGAMGTVGPAAVERLGNEIRFHFPPPFVCAGETTFFFGFSSSEPPHLGALPAEVSVVR